MDTVTCLFCKSHDVTQEIKTRVSTQKSRSNYVVSYPTNFKHERSFMSAHIEAKSVKSRPNHTTEENSVPLAASFDPKSFSGVWISVS